MQIVSLGDNLHEISNPIFFESKNIFQNVVCWNCYPACSALNPNEEYSDTDISVDNTS